jgi:hypothetical protein
MLLSGNVSRQIPVTMLIIYVAQPPRLCKKLLAANIFEYD